MSAVNFRPSLALTLAHEGGYVNHPSDPGGPTNRGVTQRVYDAYRKYYGQKQRSVKHIDDSEVAEIYNKHYWKLIRGDSLPIGLDYAVFDFAVNSGVSRATRYLQRLVGVEDDGVLGVISLAAIENCYKTDKSKVIAQYCANRLAFVRSLRTFPVFGKGWTRRIIGNRTGAQDTDNGVIDYAFRMANCYDITTTPTAIGNRQGETPGKAIALDKPEAFPTMAVVHTAEELRALVASNDTLAEYIRND